MIPFAVLNSLVSDVKKNRSLLVNSVLNLVVLSTHAELASATARGCSYLETGQLFIFISTPLNILQSEYSIEFKHAKF